MTNLVQIDRSTVSTVAVWAATHEGRVDQWRAVVAKHEARRSMATLRKGWYGSTGPRYVAELEDGSVRRVSFWQAKGKPYDFARARKVAMGSSPVKVVRGHVEHDIPGQPWVKIEDPMTETKPRAVKPSYKAALAALVAVAGDGVKATPAYRDALQALGMAA